MIYIISMQFLIIRVQVMLINKEVLNVGNEHQISSMVTIGIEEVFPPWHQRFYPGLEEIAIMCL